MPDSRQIGLVQLCKTTADTMNDSVWLLVVQLWFAMEAERFQVCNLHTCVVSWLVWAYAFTAIHCQDGTIAIMYHPVGQSFSR